VGLDVTDQRLIMKQVRLIKMCLNETYSKVCVSKHLSHNFPIHKGIKQGDALKPLLFNIELEYGIRKDQGKLDGTEIKWDTSASSPC
jgi:hypothetical protein